MHEKLMVSLGAGSIEAIQIAEKQLGQKFSNDFIDFYLNNNGAKFRNAEIKAKSSEQNQASYELREIWPVEKIASFEVEPWNTCLVPFGEDSSGNLFVFEKADMNAVYFLDHETDERELVAATFQNFLAEIADVGQGDSPAPENAKVWVNPAFLKKQKDLGNA